MFIQSFFLWFIFEKFLLSQFTVHSIELFLSCCSSIIFKWITRWIRRRLSFFKIEIRFFIFSTDIIVFAFVRSSLQFVKTKKWISSSIKFRSEWEAVVMTEFIKKLKRTEATKKSFVESNIEKNVTSTRSSWNEWMLMYSMNTTLHFLIILLEITQETHFSNIFVAI